MGAAGLAVITGYKFIHPLVHIAVGAPHELTDEIAPELAEFAGDGFAVALLEQAGHMVVDEILDIGLQYLEVGGRG